MKTDALLNFVNDWKAKLRCRRERSSHCIKTKKDISADQQWWERVTGLKDKSIVFVAVVTPGLRDKRDTVARTLASRNYIPWEDLRFYDTDSIEMREAIADCAGQIIEAMGRLEHGDQ